MMYRKNTQVKLYIRRYVWLFIILSVHSISRCPHADQIIPKLPAPRNGWVGLL